MKVLFSHPTGNANVRGAVKAMAEEEILFQFHTAIATFNGDFLDRLAHLKPLTELRRRSFDTDLRKYTKTHPWRELGRLAALKSGITSLVTHEKGYFSVDAVYKNFDGIVAGYIKNAAKNGVNAVYAYEDGAIQTFSKAKEYGQQCLYDLPIGYWRLSVQILQKEQQRWPSWTATLPALIDSKEKLEAKDAELSLADKIIVASSFTEKTLEAFPGELRNVKVIKYGFPDVSTLKEVSDLSRTRQLQLLYVGGLTQRKGLADLFEAVKPFKDKIHLTIVGQRGSNYCQALEDELQKHTYIPTLSHLKVLELMRRNDVLVFPSLFEGFGLVITEAMSQGTPVITTDRTVGPDFIKHGENGWLMNAGNIDDLKLLIDQLLTKPAVISHVGYEAMQTASRRPWSAYKRELIEYILNGNPSK